MSRILVLACTILFATSLPAQAFVAIPPDRVGEYRVRFSNFFPSHDAEVESRTATYRLLDELRALRGKVGASSSNLLRALELHESVTANFNRHIIYRQLLVAVDSRDTASQRQAIALQADLEEGVAFVASEVANIDARTLTRFQSDTPALERLAFTIERSRRRVPHALAAATEAAAARTRVLFQDSITRRYQQAAARAQSATVDVNGSATSTAQLVGHADPAIREAAWKRRSTAYNEHRDSLARVIIDLVTARNADAVRHHFRNGAEQQHFELFLESDKVRALYERILAHGDLHRRYQRLHAERARNVGKFTSPAIWNQVLSDPATRAPRLTIDEASAAMRASVTPFGHAVQSQVAAILDPSNGRLDIAPGPSRSPVAFAWGVPGLMTTFVYQPGFRGSYRDVTTLFHEVSHALHGELLGQNRALVTSDMGPPYLSEGIAMFFELLLNDHLIRAEQDSSRRVLLLEQFLWRTMLTFNLTRQAAFEHAIYEGIQAGRVRNATDLDNLNASLGRSVSIWFDIHPELRNDWSSTAQYVATPLYLPNYTYASVLGLELFRKYVSNPQSFVPRFTALLQGGFADSPDRLLRRHLDIDLDRPATVNAIMSIIESKFTELEAAYGR